jgi:hypothetical protein
VFGVANVTKMLHELPPPHREDCVNSLAYEADARVQDPVYGCVGAISVLQQQVFTSFALAFFFSSSQSLSPVASQLFPIKITYPSNHWYHLRS